MDKVQFHTRIYFSILDETKDSVIIISWILTLQEVEELSLYNWFQAVIAIRDYDLCFFDIPSMLLVDAGDDSSEHGSNWLILLSYPLKETSFALIEFSFVPLNNLPENIFEVKQLFVNQNTLVAI